MQDRSVRDGLVRLDLRALDLLERGDVVLAFDLGLGLDGLDGRLWNRRDDRNLLRGALERVDALVRVDLLRRRGAVLDVERRVCLAQRRREGRRFFGSLGLIEAVDCGLVDGRGLGSVGLLNSDLGLLRRSDEGSFVDSACVRGLERRTD